MKRLLILGATFLASAIFLPSTSSAQSIACAEQVPSPLKGHWYYRIVDGRKCWYQGKALLPKSSLHWPKSSVAEVETTKPVPEADAAEPATDGRNVTAPPTAEPAAWPTPVMDDTSFESRWRGLRPES